MTKLTKSHLVLAGCLILASCQPETRDTPLYQDPQGWQIWSAYTGDRIIEPVIRAKETAINLGYPLPYTPGIDYLAMDPLGIYGFAVIIPDQQQILWTLDATITIYYEQDGDTLSSTSIEFFFCGLQLLGPYPIPGRVVSSNEMIGAFPLPNSRVYSTPNENPIVFARFLFGREPHSLLRCTVANVQVTGGN